MCEGAIIMCHIPRVRYAAADTVSTVCTNGSTRSLSAKRGYRTGSARWPGREFRARDANVVDRALVTEGAW